MSTQTTSPAWVPADTFGHRLLLLRVQLGLTAEEISDLCGVARPTWLTWEKGTKPRDFEAVVQRIVDATSVDRTWLAFGGTLAPRGGPNGPKLLRLDSNQEPPGFRVRAGLARSGERRSLVSSRSAA